MNSEFNPSISNAQTVNGELQFILSGSDDYGFDKSLANAIRRTLLTDIPTVGFKINENGENNDINMIINNSSLHNEMLLHRISLIPLYINPVNFMKNYLFEPGGDLVVTDPEGYVAIDATGNAVKFVDRLEFSRANFAIDKGSKFKKN